MATTSTALDSQQTSPQASFLSLPPELRLHIYEYLAARVDDLRRQAREGTSSCRGRRPSNRLAILALSKQIFAEAMPVLYSRMELGPILVGIPQFAAKHVQRITVTCEYVDKRWLASFSLERRDVVVGTLWRYVLRIWPEVREVRVVVTRVMRAEFCKVDKFEYGTFYGIAKLPKLRRVAVEKDVDMWCRDRELREAIKGEVEGAGKAIVVDHEADGLLE